MLKIMVNSSFCCGWLQVEGFWWVRKGLHRLRCVEVVVKYHWWRRSWSLFLKGLTHSCVREGLGTGLPPGSFLLPRVLEKCSGEIHERCLTGWGWDSCESVVSHESIATSKPNIQQNNKNPKKKKTHKKTTNEPNISQIKHHFEIETKRNPNHHPDPT